MPTPVDDMNALIQDVLNFAVAAEKASHLPGGQFGPRDAFRHMVGSAELTRRIGLLPALTLTDANEARSLFNELRRRANGRDVPAVLRGDARTMDRSNNAVGHRIGLRARTPDEIIAAAQVEIDRAYQLGPVISSSGERAGWFPPARWVEPTIGEEGSDNWPPHEWPDIIANPAVRAYPGHGVDSLYRRQDAEGGDGGEVFVRPHMREGHPVSGYTRAAPGQ